MVRYLSFIRWDPVAGSYRTTEFEKGNPGIRENRGGGTLHRSLEKVRIVSVSHSADIDLTQEVTPVQVLWDAHRAGEAAQLGSRKSRGDIRSLKE